MSPGFQASLPVYQVQPLRMERHRPFQILLRESGLLSFRFHGLHSGVLFVEEPGQCLIDQRRPSLQIAQRDQLAFGVLSQPAFAVTQQFVDFSVTGVIVLVIVEHRKQDVKMREEIVNRRMNLERQAKIGTLAPFGELLLKRDRRGINAVSEGLEESAQRVCSAACADYLDCYFQWQFGIHQLRPFLAFARQSRTKDASHRDGEKR